MLLVRAAIKNTPQSRFRVRFKFFNKYNNMVEFNTKYVAVNKKIFTGRLGVKHTKYCKKTELKRIANIKKIHTLYFVETIGNFRTVIREYTVLRSIYGN